MILGVDFASIDGNTVDAGAAYAAGVRFAYLRASRGQHTDPTFAQNASALRAAGITVGAYSAPMFHVTAPDARSQILALRHGALGLQHGTDLPPALDFELTGRGAADTGRSQSDLRKFAVELVHAARAEFGIWPMIYTSHVQMCDDNTFGGFPLADTPGADPAEVLPGDCPLWLKVPYRLRARQPLDRQGPRYPHYGADPHDPADFYRVPPAWQRSGWWLLQFQGDATGVAGFSRTVDANAFDILWSSELNQNPRVQWVQRRLTATGDLSIPDDGVYGPHTERAVQWFQTARGVKTTSRAGASIDLATFCALAWVP